jgi:hypothetical protein
MFEQQCFQAWMKTTIFARLRWTPTKEYIADHLNNSCIGVMHIVDMDAYSIHNQVSVSLLMDNPSHRPGGWSICWPSLSSRQGESHALSNIYNTRIVQWRWGGGVLTLNCNCYGTSSLRELTSASWHGYKSLNWGKSGIPQRPKHLVVLIICNSSNM